MDALDFLNQRRSVPARQLAAPGPSADELQQMLATAMRVPDHGKLALFRILAIEGDSRERLGGFLADRALERDPSISASAQDKDRQRFSHAPLVLTVITRLQAHPKVPQVEQWMTAGCVCLLLLQAAQSLGYGAQWLTGWAAQDAPVKRHLGLGDDEEIAGFVHIGTPRGETPERLRPDVQTHFSVWQG